jgi:DNA-directed RNA polymerase specialized sigma subunit, sigma24 homolog
MAVHAGDRTSEFEALRPRLQAVAYRLTGSVADAEDIVQDAWLRLHSATAEIEDLPAWLTTVVSRLGLDRLRSAVYRRETYVGEWLPEPDGTGDVSRVSDTLETSPGSGERQTRCFIDNHCVIVGLTENECRFEDINSAWGHCFDPK